MILPFLTSKAGGRDDLPFPPKLPGLVKLVSSASYENKASKGTHVCLKRTDVIFEMMAAYIPLESNDRDEHM